MTRKFENAGVAGFFVSDQVFPNRCGYLPGKQIVPVEQMLAKIKAAVDARTDPDLLIVARTDAIAVEGFSAAIDRAHAFKEAGADIGFVEAPTSAEQMAAIGKLPWPQIANIVIGGKTPEKSNAELKALGFAGVLYANTVLQAAVLGMQRALGHLKQNGQIGNAANLLATFAERQRLVDIASFQDMERKYK
jgi:2-methylisocitrate lyase-like PEP mutase family enzyme